MKTNRGLTLIEVLVVTALVAILASFGSSMYRTMILLNSMTTSSNNFLTSLHNTRSEAVERQMRVTMCIPKAYDPSNWGSPAIECDPAASDWSNGWAIFVDNDRDGKGEEADIIEVVTDKTKHATIIDEEDGNAGVTWSHYISYTQSGVTRDLNAAGGTIRSRTFVVCDDAKSQDEHRVVRILKSGTPRVEKKETACPLT